MKIRLVKAWGPHEPGTILQPGPKTLQQMLIKEGFGVEVKVRKKRARPRKRRTERAVIKPKADAEQALAAEAE